MSTIYLRFVDRAVALSVLGTALGFDPTQDADGRQIYSTGRYAGALYHVDFLADRGVIAGAGEDHVNLLWPDGGPTMPDLSAHQVVPVSPSCGFAA